jgi:hypothetical protein
MSDGESPRRASGCRTDRPADRAAPSHGASPMYAVEIFAPRPSSTPSPVTRRDCALLEHGFDGSENRDRRR